jgi:hypothetical protein
LVVLVVEFDNLFVSKLLEHLDFLTNGLLAKSSFGISLFLLLPQIANLQQLLSNLLFQFFLQPFCLDFEGKSLFFLLNQHLLSFDFQSSLLLLSELLLPLLSECLLFCQLSLNFVE